MASGTPAVVFADSTVKMRWREPYITEGLNKKIAGVSPRGIYRGFRLAYSGTPMVVSVEADPTKNDHVAVYETDTATSERYSIRLEQTSGDFTVDLTSWPSQLVYIALYAEYSTLAASSASLRVYTVAEYAGAVEKGELVILGTVNVPAAGVISEASIQANVRTLPWENVSAGARKWVEYTKNSDFSNAPKSLTAGLDFGEVAYWTVDPDFTSSDLTWRTDTSDKLSGTQSLVLYAETASSPVGVVLNTETGIVPVEEGQLLRCRFVYKVVQTPTGGDLAIKASFSDEEVGTATLTSVDIVSAVALATVGSWIVKEASIVVPSGMRGLYRVGLYSGTDIEFGSTGPGILVDSLQIWIEPGEYQPDLAEQARYGDSYTRDLYFRRSGVTHIGYRSDPVITSVTAGELRVRRADNNQQEASQPVVDVRGTVEAGYALILPSSGSVFDVKASETPRFHGHYRSSATIPNLMTLWEEVGSSWNYREYAWDNSHRWTVNARFDGTAKNWQKDVTGVLASAIIHENDYFYIYWKDAGTDTWTSWDTRFAINLATGEVWTFGDTNVSGGTLEVTPATNYTPAFKVPRVGGALTQYISEFPSAAVYIREYYHSTDEYSITVNARYDSLFNFYADDTNEPLSLFFISNESIGFYVANPPHSSPATSERVFRSGLLQVGSDRVGWIDVGDRFDDDNLAAGDYSSPTTRLYNRNMVKAWAILTTNGTGGVTVDAGYNISTALISGIIVEVFLDSPLDSVTTICPVASVEGLANIASPLPQSFNEIEIWVWNTGGTLEDLSSTTKTLFLVVLGVS